MDEEIGDGVRTLEGVVGSLRTAADEMRTRRKTDPLLWASGTYPARMAFGDVTMACKLAKRVAGGISPR
jgi:hypothetical protein